MEMGIVRNLIPKFPPVDLNDESSHWYYRYFIQQARHLIRNYIIGLDSVGEILHFSLLSSLFSTYHCLI